jgi:hypothetical protein
MFSEDKIRYTGNKEIIKRKGGEGFNGSFLIMVKTVEETVTEGMKSE